MTIKISNSDIISTTTINMSSPTININANTFRFVPWISSINSSSISNIVTASTTNPTANSGSSVVYRYSIIGNSMYVNYCFYQTNAGTSGSGTYLYTIPASATYYLDSTDIQQSADTNYGSYGTKVGTVSFKRYGTNNSMGGVYISGSGSSARFIIWSEVGSGGYGRHDNNTYGYGGASLSITYDAVIPILP